MNKAFYIIGVPAFIVSFCWLLFGWGIRMALIVTGTELAAAVAGIVYFSRRESARPNKTGTTG
jgi:hypothetical protein